MTEIVSASLPWANQPYSIKRYGTTISNCDFEPVQTPGCIQSHGALLVLSLDELRILQVSENSEAWLGQAAATLLGQPAAAVIGQGPAARLREVFDTGLVTENPLFAFTLEQSPQGPLDATVHTIDGVALLEFERNFGDAGAPRPDCYSRLKWIVSRLQGADSLRSLCQAAVEEIRQLTGFDRVMAYRFHPDWHGEVYAESRRDDLAPWLGLHYPAEDIPKPAREVFRQIWIRPLPDASAEPVELVPLANPATGRPLTLTHCALRGASVMYTEYLRNIRVAASLTLSLRREGRLWGLVACHHYTPRQAPYEIRAAAEFLAQVISLQITAAEEREFLAYRLRMQGIHAQLITAAAELEEPVAMLTKGQPNLGDGIEAGGVAVCDGGRWWCCGRTPAQDRLDALAAWLASRPELRSPARPVYATDSLVRDYPEGGDLAEEASGLLAVALSTEPRHLLLWFRPETIQSVDWAGHPDDKPVLPGPHGPRLTPRVSFELFRESVRQRSLPWKAVEIDAALELRLNLMQLIVGRATRLAALNAELQRSNRELDAFAYVASHDLKEPLRGISKYAHRLLETAEQSDEESREQLAALIRLTRRMDSLLESLLQFSRAGRTQLVLEATDLNALVGEALEVVLAHRDPSGIDILISRPLPEVACDRIRCREIFVNLLSNALKYNQQPRPRIEIGYLAAEDARPGVPAGTTGQPVFFVRDNGIGIEARHIPLVFKMFKRLHGQNDYGGGTGAGLSIAQMLVERHHGRIWLESLPGVGSTFYFTLTGGGTEKPEAPERDPPGPA